MHRTAVPQSLPEFLAAQLGRIERSNQLRRRRGFSAMDGPRLRDAAGRDLRLFCSNDYLGLAAHPQLRAAWAQGVARYGVGSTSSQYINGHSCEISAFEEELAAYLGYPRALLFGSGYLVNTGVIDALVGKPDHIISDALNHASLIDGCRLSGARVQRYAHADLAAAAAALAACGAAGQRMLISDGVFSMDGDVADLPGLAALAAAHQAWLMVDDAHGLGVLGPQGRGSFAAQGLGVEQVPVLTGTLGKSFGVYGAFVAGSADLIEYLAQVTRSVIFTTALPPALVASLRVALSLVQQADEARAHLQGLIAHFRAGLAALGLPDTGSQTPIQPLLVGSEEAALALSAALLERGFWVTAIRPPTVPPGTCRLRITLSAAHARTDVEDLLQALQQIMR